MAFREFKFQRKTFQTFLGSHNSMRFPSGSRALKKTPPIPVMASIVNYNQVRAEKLSGPGRLVQIDESGCVRSRFSPGPILGTLNS
jgi:hypothetical protein